MHRTEKAPGLWELAPEATEGACGQKADSLLWGGTCWWLSSPGYNFLVCYPIGFLQVLASRALLSCSGKKVSKEAGSRGEQLAPARIVPPLRIPREEPSGIDPSLWLGVVGFGLFPRWGLWGLGVYLSHAVD